MVIYLDCSNTEVLGVMGKDIHLKTHGYNEETEEEFDNLILLVPEKVYLKEWKKWIEGKRRYCELHNFYCGVMGYVLAENPKYVGMQTINNWNNLLEDYETIEVPVYKASIFSDVPDFERG
jgi:hypothetical protein